MSIVEDACQAHGTRVGGRYAGAIGRAGCFSTHDRKLLATGEGGFVLTNDDELADRIDFYTHLGHLRGLVHGVKLQARRPAGRYRPAPARAPAGPDRHPPAHRQRLVAALPAGGLLREFDHGTADRPTYYNLVLAATDRQSEIAQVLAGLGLPPGSVRYGYRPRLFAEYATTCPNGEALATSTFQIPAHPGLAEPTIEWMARPPLHHCRRRTRSMSDQEPEQTGPTIRHFTASAIVFDDQDRVPLVHHNKVRLGLYPGGHIDPNEDPAQAAQREVLEETGIHTEIISDELFSHPAVTSQPSPFTIIEMDVADRKVGPHRHIDLVYVLRALDGDLAAQPEEVSGARWIPIARLSDFDTPAELPALIEHAARWATNRSLSPATVNAT